LNNPKMSKMFCDKMDGNIKQWYFDLLCGGKNFKLYLYCTRKFQREGD